MDVIESLVVVSRMVENKIPKLMVFHTFQTDRNTQFAGKADGGLYNHLGVLFFQNAEYETLVIF